MLERTTTLTGLIQEQLAAKIGTKKSYISKIENGHADVQPHFINPSLEAAYLVVDALTVHTPF
jgi:transcriptional regulator with XRE-family HTH domain